MLWDRGDVWEVLKISILMKFENWVEFECDIDRNSIFFRYEKLTIVTSFCLSIYMFFKLDFILKKYDTTEYNANFELFHRYLEDNDIICGLTQGNFHTLFFDLTSWCTHDETSVMIRDFPEFM